MIAPKTEPLFRLSALPNTKRFKNIYEETNDKGNIDKLKLKSLVRLKEKRKYLVTEQEKTKR